MKSEFTIVFFIVAFVTGCWSANVVKLVNCDFVSPYKCEAIHAAGLILSLIHI